MGKLSKEKVAELDALQFCWDPAESFWHRNFEELKLYKQANRRADGTDGRTPRVRLKQGQRRAKKGKGLPRLPRGDPKEPSYLQDLQSDSKLLQNCVKQWSQKLEKNGRRHRDEILKDI